MSEECGNCRSGRDFEFPNGKRTGFEMGVCVRYAPRPTAVLVASWGDIDKTLQVFWPMVMSSDWCGEYEPQPVEAKEGASA